MGLGQRIRHRAYLGRIKYHDETKLVQNDFFGVLAGFHMGRGTMFLGYYWRGRESGLETTIPLQGFGGSAFVFNPAIGVNINSKSLQKLFGASAKGYFVELQGVDFFNNTRLIAGVNWQL